MSSKRKTAKRKAAAPGTKPGTTRAAAARKKKVTGTKTGTARRAAAKKAGARAAARRPAAKKSAAKRPAAKKSAARRPAAKRPAAKRPAAKRSAAKRPGTELPAAEERVLAPQPEPVTPSQPPAQDEIELSGVWGRVRYSESDPDAEVKEIFSHYDRDKSGKINASELARILEALGMELEEHELKVALLDIDRDQDGKIGWDEFLPWWRSMAS